MQIKIYLKILLAFFVLQFVASNTKAQTPSSATEKSVNELQLKSALIVNPYEFGYSDFPATVGDITISLTTTGNIDSYPDYSSCGVNTKNSGLWMSDLVGSTIKNTFSSAVNNVAYNITASDNGEAITITTSDGTPTITVSTGCDYIVSGNVISFTGGNDGAQITIVSSSPYTWVQLSHNGAGSGSIVTLDASSMVVGTTAVPVNGFAIALLFLLVGAFAIFRSKRLLLNAK